jgi:hypothetical protein
MTAAAHVRSSENRLWSRLLARFRFARDLTRPRVPLVLRRMAALASDRPAVDRSVRAGPQYHLALHVHLSWPQWLVRQQHTHMSSAHPVLSRTLVQRLITPAVTVGPAPTAREMKAVGATLTAAQRTPAAVPTPPSASDLQVRARREQRTTLQRVTSRRSDPLAARQPLVRRALESVGAEAGNHIGATIVGRTPEPRSDRQVESEPPRGTADTTLISSVHRRVQAWATQAETRSTRLATRNVTRAHTVANRVGTEAARHLRSTNGSAPTAFARTALRSRAQAASSMPDARVLGGTTPFVHAASRTKVHANAEAAQPTAAVERTSAQRRPEPAAPPLNIERLSDEVYRHIQKKMRIERERRGL